MLRFFNICSFNRLFSSRLGNQIIDKNKKGPVHKNPFDLGRIHHL